MDLISYKIVNIWDASFMDFGFLSGFTLFCCLQRDVGARFGGINGRRKLWFGYEWVGA